MIERINSKYDGNYDEFGRRHSKGTQIWDQCGKVEQKYDGEFFRDCLHGQGAYKWQKENGWETYDGYFYGNVKEGYAVASLPNGSTFEGLFRNNLPFGPGILTYENGRQDAGFWLGSKIIRLSRVVDYIIPRLASSSLGKIKLFPYRKIITVNLESNDIALRLCKNNAELAPRLYSNFINDPRSLFFNKLNFDKTYFIKLNFENLKIPEEEIESAVQNFHYMEAEEEEKTCFDGLKLMKSKSMCKSDLMVVDDEKLKPNLVCWNRNSISEDIIKHIFNYRSFEDKLSFEISSIMTGDRMEFKKTGLKERESIDFLKMCSIGPARIVKELLCSYEISEELTDARGNNSLMFAVCSDQHEVIEMLLDHGVDVNSFNDEHLTALNLCLLRRIAQANKILNWETAFLPPSPDTDQIPDLKNRNWEGTKSIESLDRIFGDGNSINEDPIPFSVREQFPASIQPSYNYFDKRHDTTLSAVTVFKFNQQRKPLKTESIYYDKNRLTKIVPKTIKRDEYLESVAEPGEKDKYFFYLSPEPAPPVVEKKAAKGKGAKEIIVEEKLEEEEPEDEEVIKICEMINKTIEKLLKRGADANISEVPKSSLHLAVFTKDPWVVEMMLSFDAFVDTRSQLSEGYLTPLHVVVLVKPAEEFAEICRILLVFDANVEAETSPDFNPNGEMEIFLDDEQGRTPLQLLCMRPDLQYIKHNEYLVEMALILAKISDREKYFKGYDFMTLAMLRGNIKLVEAFLASQVSDPNETCEHGTPLHVLVSSFLQIRIPYDDSIQMCDLLLNNGADPLKKFVKNTCVEFGYKEINEEKERRKLEKGKDKGKGRDYLKDHVRVVEYLEKKIKEIEEKKRKEEEEKMRKKLEQEEVKKNLQRFYEGEEDEMGGGGRKEKKGKEKLEDRASTDGKEMSRKGKTEEAGGKESKEKGKSDKNGKDGGGKKGAEKINEKKEETGSGGKKAAERINKESRESGSVEKKREEKINKEKSEKSNGGGKNEKNDKENSKKTAEKDETDKGNPQSRPKSDDRIEKTKEKNLQSSDKGEKVTKADKSPLSKSQKKDKSNINIPGRKKSDKKVGKIPEKNQRDKKSDANLDVQKPKPKKNPKKFEKSTKDIFIKGETIKSISGNLSETLQRLLYEILGNCQDSINVNDLLLPYVVLRDGDLYYRFKGQKPKNMEAYSLIKKKIKTIFFLNTFIGKNKFF